MSESEPSIIQTDAPFNVQAVRTKTGRIDALSKRPRIDLSSIPEVLEADSGTVDPSRRIADTRVKILADESTELEASVVPATEALDPASADPAPVDALPDPAPPLAIEASDALDTTDSPALEVEAAPVALNDLQRRMQDIKNTNQSVVRELEALEETLKQAPPAV